MSSDVIVMVIVWAVAFYVGMRLFTKQPSPAELTSYSDVNLFPTLLGAGMIFSFRVLHLREIGQDLLGTDFPLGLWLRNLAIIFVVWAYLLVVRHLARFTPALLRHDETGWRRWLYWLPLVALVGQVGIFIASIWGGLAYPITYYGLLVTLHIPVVTLILTIIIPVNRRFYQLEAVKVLRVKYVATIGLCLVYLVPFLPTVAITCWVLVTGEMVGPIDYYVLAPVGALCILIKYVPYRVLNALLTPWRYWQYYRLCRLEKRVLLLAGQLPNAVRLVLPTQLENAIHRKVITIMDYCPDIKPEEAQALKRLLEHIQAEHEDYHDLVHALLRVHT